MDNQFPLVDLSPVDFERLNYALFKSSSPGEVRRRCSTPCLRCCSSACLRSPNDEYNRVVEIALTTIVTDNEGSLAEAMISPPASFPAAGRTGCNGVCASEQPSP